MFYHFITFLLFFVFLTILFGIATGKGISRIYKYDQQNCHYPSPNTTFVLPQSSKNSIQNQRIDSSDAYVGANDLDYSVLDQIPNHHGNTDVNNTDKSQ